MSKEFSKKLSYKLRQIRETLAHSRDVMARHLDVHVRDIDRYEAGEQPLLSSGS